MSKIITINLNSQKGLNEALEAYQTINMLSENEIETLEIMSNKKDKELILAGIAESKENKVRPLKSIL